MKDYKDTLLIGKTNFEMKGNLSQKEPIIQSEWEKNNIYKLKLKNNENKEKFILHDGPPYANGDIHVGHSLNKILKDLIIRYKNSNGFYSDYIMGWDTHGLPIESAITKQGIDRNEYSPSEFREMCKNYALNQVEKQSSQFKRIGIFTDYNKIYLTLNQSFENSQLKLFNKMVDKNLIYRDLKPIYWSPSSETALAEAEIEYKDVRSPSIYVALKLINSKKFKDCEIVIWTTTPWTLPSNQLIAVNPDLTYCVVEYDKRKFIICKDTFKTFTNDLEFESAKIISDFLGKELINESYAHPWKDDDISKVVSGHHVTNEAGTGIVHIAGGFGEDDFLIVKKNGLEPFVPISDDGKFDIRIKDSTLEGLFYLDANKIIGEKLEKNEKLLKLKFIKHSYPHDWRTKQPIMFRATSQWFVSLEGIKKELDKVIVKSVETKPDWSKERLRNIIKDRYDWTISRQRLWGVPIIAFYNENKEPQLSSELVEYARNVIAEKGTNSWFELETDIFLPEKFRNKNWTKEKDILDVWFDSGSSNIALEDEFNLKRPYDIYFEGNDQYRGWFNSSMINSVIYDGKSAYKKIITHGMTNDSKGNKMSKSIGNTIDPLEIISEFGADVLRLWVLSTDYTDDQKIGNEILKQVSESYRKIRNTIRFLLANLFDFNPSKNYQLNLEEVDKYSLNKLTLVKNEIINAYDEYKFNNIYKLINNYINNDLSSFYLDFAKDILYIEAKDSLRRRQIQTVMYEQLWMLFDVLKPILPHTTEEAYSNIMHVDKEKSIHLLDFKNQNFIQDKELVKKWNIILDFRNSLNEALEEFRNQKSIKKAFETKVTINLKPEFNFIKEIKDLNKILIVNEFVWDNIKIGIEKPFGIIFAEPKEGQKCLRCWSINDKLLDGEICQRCSDVLKG